MLGEVLQAESGKASEDEQGNASENEPGEASEEESGKASKEEPGGFSLAESVNGSGRTGEGWGRALKIVRETLERDRGPWQTVGCNRGLTPSGEVHEGRV